MSTPTIRLRNGILTVDSVVASGPAASRPAATGSGVLYFCTDLAALYFDNPATNSWQQFATESMPAPTNLAQAPTPQ
jgi:hypothetical protein